MARAEESRPLSSWSVCKGAKQGMFTWKGKATGSPEELLQKSLALVPDLRGIVCFSVFLGPTSETLNPLLF